ncbi:3-oxoacyl-[acyl-carrier-protein] synthase II [Hydrogenivirga caldilitoris]|uniref:3-oxoacyl-[acyl-carrier-protein] synthase 2 n=1 Tax=Hydrogenivirga caldilitoris TaxID=246264 RepID=A0A497XNE5_9AQUI|nr:beta-ketoacyl-ACP synthase II [Hydrogenivirga caldilitoris]RLJ70388.1 3-oxoacyl-[acyl-carrier-protein] synthase II [Hydrogenivirga caldilitoris]
MRRRVVVTGLGAVTPIGTGVDKFWTNLVKGVSGIDHIKSFDPAEFGLNVTIAGEVKDFDPMNFLDKKEASRLSIFVHYAVAAAEEAILDSGIKEAGYDPLKIGVIIGTGIGGLRDIEREHTVITQKGARRVSPFFIPYGISNMGAGYVAIRHGFKGPNYCVVSACATGNHSIGDAFRMIQAGDIDAAIAGGTEAAITPLGVAGFAVMRALSTRNDEPQKASRPFDRDRDGFVMGEGAGILVLEEYERAKARGAKIYAELVGYGATDDAYHITAPHECGEGAYECMRLALEDAGLNPDEIDYINAHGTSTPLNDKIETLAIKQLFKEHAYKLKISSNKSMIGHLLGAAGAVEAVASVKTIETGLIPPTINLENPDPECDLDYVPNEAVKANVRTVLSNSFGFGGTNACLIFKKCEDV